MSSPRAFVSVWLQKTHKLSIFSPAICSVPWYLLPPRAPVLLFELSYTSKTSGDQQDAISMTRPQHLCLLSLPVPHQKRNPSLHEPVQREQVCHPDGVILPHQLPTGLLADHRCMRKAMPCTGDELRSSRLAGPPQPQPAVIVLSHWLFGPDFSIE